MPFEPGLSTQGVPTEKEAVPYISYHVCDKPDCKCGDPIRIGRSRAAKQEIPTKFERLGLQAKRFRRDSTNSLHYTR
jgi:hypothetical protein